jgi:hypothetical protein
VSRIKVDALQGTSGSDTAITLSGANATVGGTLAVTGIHTVGNNAIYTSDGSAVTQNTVQSLVKCWVQFDGTASGAAARDSFNVGSMTDGGTGIYTVTFTNNMSNDDFAVPVGAQDTSTRTSVHTSFEGQSTSTILLQHYENDTSTDTNRCGIVAAGDLA